MIVLSLFGIGFESPTLILAGAALVMGFMLLNRELLGSKGKLAILLIRCAALMALFLVLAMPYMVREEEVLQETTSVLAIEDQTDSMAMCESSLASEAARRISERIGGVAKVELLNMSTANRTALGDTIYQGIVGSSMKNNVVILASDGNNNYGADPIDVAAFAAGAKAKIFALLPKIFEGEVYIADVEGAEKTPVNSRYSGRVSINGLGSQSSYRLQILIDGSPVLDTPVVQNTPSKDFPFEHVFNTKGPHNVTAKVFPESSDRFTQNNIFNKVVNVIERPRVLLVTARDGAPLQQVLEEIYEVDAVSRVPAEISPYSAIVLDDQPAEFVFNLEDLREFLNSGGGLMVVGGNNSYENGGYYGSQLEGVLPVRSTEAPKKKGEKINVVIILDISGSTGNTMGGDTKIDVEKAIAVNIIRDVSKNADIGVAAFNSDSFLIQSIRKTEDTSTLEDKISRLQFGGGTYVVTGLNRASDMLKSVEGSKYVVLISDGVTNYPVQAFDKAASLAQEGVIVNTVGVGFDTDESFMKGLAARGGGVYFKPSETQRVNIAIGKLEEGEGEGGPSMIITDTHHFITEGLSVSNVSIKDFNDVTAKSSAQVLAATGGMKPLLTVWRFGLGRVASLTLDDGKEWASKLYSEGSSKLISSTVNWAIGDPERKKDMRIDCVDTRVGEETSVVVISKAENPQVSIGGRDVELTRLDEDSYYFSYYPEITGFVSVSSPGYKCAMAVNYAEEYGKLGVDYELLDIIVNMTGGKTYLSDDLWSLVDEVASYTFSESTGVAVKKINMQLWFTLAALALFFTDIVIRRLREIRQSKVVEKEHKLEPRFKKRV